jgi:dinuclear metal center YbgI/SA1388 family protein
MRLKAVIEALQTIAPEPLAEGWDQVGLHLGDPAQTVRRGLLCIDLAEAVLDEAIAAKANLIVAYHPPIFTPLERLTTANTKQRIILRAAEKRIAVYSPHTALDAATGGVNDWLASGCGEGVVTPIIATESPADYKLIVFVPHDHADRLRDALSNVGAGVIGDYTQCSFATPGEGTFQGGKASNPTVGKRGNLERVAEWRMEMICPAAALGLAIETLRAVHPYEQPAFDVYRMHNPAPPPETGQGRIVELSRAVSLTTLAARLKTHLGVKHLQINAASSAKVRRIGVCAGAGGSLLDSAGDIDAFFTGEMRHHDILAAVASGTSVLLAGHTETERPYLKVYRKRIARLAGDMTWSISKTDRAPGRII